MAPGKLITIEGIDGAGKSTLAAALAGELARRSVEVVLLREPGGVPLSERVRTLVSDASLAISDRAEALLYAAARAELVSQKVGPSLAEGKVVLLDRFVDSSLAYQGSGRGLGVEQVREVNLLATGGLVPDRTLFLRIAPSEGRSRLSGRGPEDRMEQEDDGFFARVAAGYDELAAAEPERIRTIDASQPEEAVLRDALAALADLTPGA